ncbi:hypothetical protein BDV26DRAFT_302870 [Aspergillus bertholletiae]|uniref:AMP-dependent synthetase/ligase domain-containing protein n=1 Tax=Aspergillus bertholletiae TaxID=1226010 RepID=A0A5N7BFB0_9EURO|nr:hypothetical protein BDV26DRAFT_302870 [Aspergillus bertholletiae]
MAPTTFPLREVLAVADIHPFYNPNVQYPPSPEALKSALELAHKQSEDSDLSSRPLVSKKDLYKAIARLTDDTSPQNEYRRSSYVSITGGGSGGLPLMFMTDTKENRNQRTVFGEFLSTCGVVEPNDWILTTHVSGYFYRSLDLMSEMLENAGATVFSAGNYMTPAEVVDALAHYHINVITGDGSQVIQVVHHISTLPAEERSKINLTKVLYTSEPLTEAQRSHITATLGPVKISSVWGSAEAGPCALTNPDLISDERPPGTSDFIFDTRQVVIEILPPSASEGDSSARIRSVPDGEEGIIVQTSLLRRRNPLVRYITGDIGSLQPLPEKARAIIPESEHKHLRVLRLRGRDRRFSFKWFAMYFEFENIVSFMQADRTGILQWQVILDTLESSPQTTLEIRLLRQADSQQIMSKKEFVDSLEKYFFILDENRHLFQITFVDDLSGFEKSSTGNKVMKFVDRLH